MNLIVGFILLGGRRMGLGLEFGYASDLKGGQVSIEGYM